MSCYNPLRAKILGIDSNGKKILKIIPASDFKEDDSSYISLPCGRCIGCRLKYSRQWADRCMAEASYHDSNVFLTLTYNDEHLPDRLVKEVDVFDEDGDYVSTSEELSPFHPLVKRDLQLFIKRLRKRFPKQHIRYFACGEYGPSTHRPHFHLLLFGLRLPDLQYFKTDTEGHVFSTSETIKELWYRECDKGVQDIGQRSAGFHIISDVNWSTCAYVARYIMKKQFGQNSDIYEKLNFPPEFTLMSRRPGIGRQYYEDHAKDIYFSDSYLRTDKGAVLIRPNKYYDSLFDIDYPDIMPGIRVERQEFAKVDNALKSNLTSLDFLSRLKSEETDLEARTRALKRKEL